MILSIDGIGSVFAAMPSLVARDHERAQTLLSARRCGLDFDVYMSADDIHGIADVIEKQNQIFMDATQHDLNWVLYFEDDLEINCVVSARKATPEY